MESVLPLPCTPTTFLEHITLQLFVVDLEPYRVFQVACPMRVMSSGLNFVLTNQNAQFILYDVVSWLYKVLIHQVLSSYAAAFVHRFTLENRLALPLQRN